MYKCCDCGHIFDDGEGAVRTEHHPEIPGGWNEYFSVCPICGGDVEETHDCEKCGGEFLYEELRGGYYCEECLKEAVTFENFLEFAEDYDKDLGESEVHLVEDFMLICVYGVRGVTVSSREFRALMMAEFKDAVAEHKMAVAACFDDKLLDKIWHYLADYRMLDDFAEWLYEKEVK